jgi:hypothetical protein
MENAYDVIIQRIQSQILLFKVVNLITHFISNIMRNISLDFFYPAVKKIKAVALYFS